jgi:hypothetical protein
MHEFVHPNTNKCPTTAMEILNPTPPHNTDALTQSFKLGETQKGRYYKGRVTFSHVCNVT